MNAFVHILQNVTVTQNKIFPYIEFIKVAGNKDELYKNLWNDYYTHESNTDKEYNVYWIYQYINGIYYEICNREEMEYNLQDKLVNNYSIKHKYKKIKEIMDNIFIDYKTKNKFMNNISTTQRAYRGFSKLSQIYKHKTSKLQITTNVMYDDIIPNHRDTIELYHEGSRYLFTKYDLTRIINTSLVNSPYYFAEPLIIRNPYNNVPFSKSILYTIYFRMMENPLKFPILFHNFVWLDFDLHLFRSENECLIREQYFRDYIYNTTEGTIINEMRNMIKMYYPTKIIIPRDFPAKDLIRILRPYYYLHLVSQYHIYGLEKTRMATDYLNDKLYELYVYNPKFGRINYTKKTPNMSRVKKFNMDSPQFTMNEAYKYHLHKKVFSDDEDDDDDDNDDSVS
jgi:hypothetical protein